MAKKLQYRRLLMLAGLLALAFVGLGYRLVDLQVLRHEELEKIAQKNTQKKYFLEPRRGDILDVKGNILATSVTMKNVCANPALMNDAQAEIVARAVAPLLQMSESEVLRRLTFRYRQTQSGTVTNLCVAVNERKNPVSNETWQKLTNAMAALNFGIDEKALPKKERLVYDNIRHAAVFAADYPVRSYPNQRLASHMLGFATTRDVQLPTGSYASEIEGVAGVENFLDAKLSGVRGWRSTEADARHREVVALREQDVEPRDGLNVVLTVDSYIQNVVETSLADAMEKHAPISITGIVMRPRTGEILAMATLPDYDPNTPGKFSADALRNRVITDCVEPGSTFKIVVVSGALNDQVVSLNDQFDCEHGHFSFAGRVLHDHDSQGILTVKGIITHSSNIGAAKIGIKMGPERLYNYITSYGFGTRTGLPLPGEISGIVHPVQNWSKVSVAQIPMGQGIAVTRLQMMMAMCAIANNGWLMRPMLVDRLEDSDGNVVARYAPERVRQVVSDDTSKQMIEALKTVVSPEGTAPKAAMTNYVVAGKTGTAQKVENGVYAHGKYVASFIGFFPADNPEVCISIVLDEPKEGYYGGQVAAPVFKQIAERVASYLNVPPDNLETTPRESLAQTENHTVKTVAAP